MDKIQIKDYVLKYKDSYSKESIKSQLINNGANGEDVESIYSEMNNEGSVYPSDMKNLSEPVKKKSHLGLIISIVFVFLIILFVGGGIVMYSFVDFGSLLPNKVELDNNLMGDASQSFAFNDGISISEDIGSGIVLTFRYQNSRRALINASDSKIILDGNVCNGLHVRNVDAEQDLDVTTFISGQPGIMYFDCESELEQGEQIEGNVEIGLINAKSNEKFVSSGTLRLVVQ